MTTQKQISHLSFAAIILVFAALPALAQTRTVDNQTVMATTDQVAALRNDRVSIPTKKSPIVVTPVVTEKQQPSFSATQFMKSATEPVVISDTTFEFTSLEKPRFNETSSKTINFVPSRGPKFPW